MMFGAFWGFAHIINVLLKALAGVTKPLIAKLTEKLTVNRLQNLKNHVVFHTNSFFSSF